MTASESLRATSLRLFDYRLSYLAPDIVKAEQGICGVLQGIANWLELARREIPKSAQRRTANSAERNIPIVSHGVV